MSDNAEQEKTARTNATTVWQELIRDYPNSQYSEFANAKLKQQTR